METPASSKHWRTVIEDPFDTLVAAALPISSRQEFKSMAHDGDAARVTGCFATELVVVVNVTATVILSYSISIAAKPIDSEMKL